MAKIQYIKKRFNNKSRALIQTANAIIENNESLGLSLTLRQLYYRFVAAGTIPNTLRSYKNLGSLISEARLAGLIDWNSIVDRERPLRGVEHFDSAAEAINEAARNFFLDWHKTQPQRIEVWVEKNALVDVLRRACAPYHVDYFSCKGYASQTGLHEAAQRHARYAADGQKSLILYLGDHDPSGKDITRDIQDRFETFGVEIEVDRIALNMDQIKKYNPPPNPAKVTDSRYDGYKREFGTKCWELDALEPKILLDMIKARLEKEIDGKILKAMKEAEQEQRDQMQLAAEKLEEGTLEENKIEYKEKIVYKTKTKIKIKKVVKTVFKTKKCKACAKRKKSKGKKK